jgi:large subunit ribosomal protein L13
MTTTFMANKQTFQQRWYVIDASGLPVGRLAVAIANIIRGKHRPTYTPHCDTGDFVIVVNADQVQFSGKKWDSKSYQAYSHYPGGLRITPAREMLARRPEFIIQEAVRRMVPRNRLGRQQMRKLKVFAGPRHEHQAQQPEPLTPEKLGLTPVKK